MSDVFSSVALNMTYALLTELKGQLQYNSDLPSIDSIDYLIDNIIDFIFIGDQSTGKSSIITRLVRLVTRLPFELYTSDGTATKVPTIIRFCRAEEESIKYQLHEISTNKLTDGNLKALNDFMKKEYSVASFKDYEMIVTVSGPNASTFSITDMPGLMSSDADSDESKAYIEQLYADRVKSKNCFVMHILNASNDVQNHASFNFIRNVLGVPAENQIIVATQVDLITQKSKDGEKKKIQHFRHFFPHSKIIFVVPQNANGFLTSEGELDALRFLTPFVDANVAFGIDVLAREIPRRLDVFAQSIGTHVLPHVKDLFEHCKSTLKNIGFAPKDSTTALNEWSHYVHQVTQVKLRGNREQVNNVLLDETNQISVQFERNNPSHVRVVEQIIERSRRTCGETRPELISRHPAFMETVQELGKTLLARVTHFNLKTLRPLFEGVVQNMFDEITSKNPACEVVSRRMLAQWSQIFEEVWSEYQAAIVHEITRGIEHPQPRRRINQDLLTTELIIEEYERAARSSTSSPDVNSLQLLKRWIQVHKADESVDVSAKAILQYVDAFWNDFSATIVSDLRSSIEEISRELHTRFNGPFLTGLTRLTETVVENETILRQRATFKIILGLCQRIIENYNHI